MTSEDVLQWITAIVTIATVLDAMIPPSTHPILGLIKTIVSTIAINFGNSQNVAPSKAIKRDQEGSV